MPKIVTITEISYTLGCLIQGGVLISGEGGRNISQYIITGGFLISGAVGTFIISGGVLISGGGIIIIIIIYLFKVDKLVKILQNYYIKIAIPTGGMLIKANYVS